MKYLAINHFNSYESEGVWYSIYSTSPLIWNTAVVYCTCDVLVDKPAGSFPHASFLDLIPFIFLSSSYSSLSPTIRIHFPKHITTCAPVHIILRSWPACVSSAVLLNVHSWMTVCYLCSFSDSWGSYILCVCVFWMRTWLNLCKMMPCLCRV